MANAMNNVAARRAALRASIFTHLNVYTRNKSSPRNMPNVVTAIKALINTYTDPLKKNGNNKGPNSGNKGLNIPPPNARINALSKLLNEYNGKTTNWYANKNLTARNSAINNAAKNVTLNENIKARIGIVKQRIANAKAAKNKAAAANDKEATAEASKRRNQLIEEARKKEAANASFQALKNRIGNVKTTVDLNTIVRNIANNGTNFNKDQKNKLAANVRNKRKVFMIETKKAEGQAKRNLRAAARANNTVNLSRGNFMNRYKRLREEINNASSVKEFNRINNLLKSGSKVRKLITNQEADNAYAALNRKRHNLKGPGPPPNAPVGGHTLPELEHIIRITRARINRGRALNGNASRLKNAQNRANELRPKKRGGLLGAARGIAHVAKGAVRATARVAGKGAKLAGGVALGAVVRAGQRSASFNVTVGGGRRRRQIPNTPIGNKKPRQSRAIAAIGRNEAIAQAHRNQWTGANESERPVSLAGGVGALAVAAGGAAALRGATAAKRAYNLSKAAKSGVYTAKTLRWK